MGVMVRSASAKPAGKVLVVGNCWKSDPLTAVPEKAQLTWMACEVSPVRWKRMMPLSGPVSEAAGSNSDNVMTGLPGVGDVEPRAICKLSRPPVTHLPASDGSRSVPANTRFLICRYVSPG